MRRIARRVLRVLVAALLLVAVTALAVFVFYMPGPSGRCRAVRRWAVSAPAGTALSHPMALAWSRGALYVAAAERGAVERYDPDGTRLSVWTGLGRPVAVALTDSLVYVADFLGDRIIVLASDGHFLRSWGRHGSGPGEFDAPSGVALDRAGTVYVTDFYNHRVQAFTADGRFLRTWGGNGRRSGKLHFPTDVAVSPAGEVLAADGFNHRVQRFTGDGRYVGKWGGIGYGVPGSWPGWFALAKDVAVDTAGRVYVADAFNGRVQVFTPEGNLLAIWGDGQPERRPLRYASAVAVGPQGHVYVSDFYGTQLWELSCH